MTLHSVNAIKQTGVAPSILSYIMQSHLNVPDDFLDLLDSYYLRYWSPNYFFSQLKFGTITDQGTKYQVIYLKSDPYVLNRSRQVKLSFRKPLAAYGNLLPIVVVTGLK